MNQHIPTRLVRCLLTTIIIVGLLAAQAARTGTAASAAPSPLADPATLPLAQQCTTQLGLTIPGAPTGAQHAERTPKRDTSVLLGGYAFLDSTMPLVNARVRLVSLAGRAIPVDARGVLRTNRYGLFLLHAASLPARYSVVVTGGSVSGHPFGARLVTDMGRSDGHMAYVSPASTLVHHYLMAHRVVTLAAARQSIKHFLGIPASMNLGSYLQAVPWAFSGKKFLLQARADGGPTSFFRTLDTQAAAGGTHPLLGDGFGFAAAKFIGGGLASGVLGTVGGMAFTALLGAFGVKSDSQKMLDQLNEIQQEIQQGFANIERSLGVIEAKIDQSTLNAQIKQLVIIQQHVLDAENGLKFIAQSGLSQTQKFQMACGMIASATDPKNTYIQVPYKGAFPTLIADNLYDTFHIAFFNRSQTDITQAVANVVQSSGGSLNDVTNGVALWTTVEARAVKLYMEWMHATQAPCPASPRPDVSNCPILATLGSFMDDLNAEPYLVPTSYNPPWTTNWYPQSVMWVDPGIGSDSNACAMDAPCRTIAYAMQIAPNQATIILNAGIFRENVTMIDGFTLQGTGTSLSVIRGTQSGAPVLTGYSSTTLYSQLYDLTVEGGTGAGGVGISSPYEMAMQRVAVVGNAGGGIVLGSGGYLEAAAIEVSGNGGPGIADNSGSALVLRNSTIANNTGGGMSFSGSGSAQLMNLTVAMNSNSGQAAGGIANNGAANGVQLANTIVSNNTNASGPSDCTGAISDLLDPDAGNIGGANWIGTSAGCNTSGLTTGDTVGRSPGLDTVDGLVNNGGPTSTIALPVGAAATGAGSAAFCNDNNYFGIPFYDQRGAVRPLDQTGGTNTCDPGAYDSGGVYPSLGVSLARTEGVDVSSGRGDFTVTFASTLPGHGIVLFGPGPGCNGLIGTATQDTGAGPTNHRVVVTGDDLHYGSTAILPGVKYWFEVQVVTSHGVLTDDNHGACYSVKIPAK